MLLVSVTFAACNKEDLNREKAMQIVINGYNGTADELEVVIDTTSYSKASNGKFMLKPTSVLGFGVVYTYRTAKGILSIKNPVTGKILFSKPLPETGTKASFNFVYVDGKDQEFNTPTADGNTNKLGFYLHYTESNDPVDIFLYRKNEATGEEFREYLAKHVMPKTWVYINYMAAAPFDDKNELRNASIYVTKAGTTDQWAIQDSESLSKVSVFGMGFPLPGEKGLVQPYFFAPGVSEMDRSRLFFYPDRPW